ncbi:MAG TPA: metal ABC transporter permease [Bryobacteraceae bacterium]|nr:metal ABC transporter permease [Bryobacteraceae bacterium]
MTENLLLSITLAIAAGLIGCFVVMRRMALAADALSHVALPGIGVALALHIHPIFGAVAMLFFGAVLVWAVEGKAGVGTEAVIGVLFSAALAVGSMMMTSKEDLVEALFGGAGVLNWPEILFSLVAATLVVAFVVTQRGSLVVMLVSPDLARTTGVNVQRLNLLYLQVFALTIALGLRYLGVLPDGGFDHHSCSDREAAG